jgi:ABC-2 type transport system permease protein
MVLDHTGLVFVRALKQSLRNPAWVVIGLVQPLLYLAFFGPLLIPVVRHTPGFPPGDAWQVLVPALLVQLGLFGSLYVGFGLIADVRTGVVERMRVTPVSRTALLLGRAGKDAVVLVVQAALLTVVAVPFGLRVPVGGAVLGLGLVGILGLATSALSYTLALRLKHEDAFAPLLNMLALPLVLLSGILIPMSVAPGWLYDLSRINPFVYIVEATRAIFRGDDGSTVWAGLGIAAALLVVTISWGVRTFQRDQA